MNFQEPILNIKKKPRKKKLKKQYITVKMWKTVNPDYVAVPSIYTKIEDMTPEQYESFKKRTCQYILQRKDRSPRFNKYQNRRISETNYRLYKGKTKVCTHCQRELGLTYFDKQNDKRHSKTYRRPYCIDCRRKKNKEAYLKRKEKNDSTGIC